MSQPVKLSDDLVREARLISRIAERSIAGQIEYWAQLGRAVEPLLEGAKALALRRSGTETRISELLDSVDTREGRRRVVEYRGRQPFPHYETAPERPGLPVQDRRRRHGNPGTLRRSGVPAGRLMDLSRFDARPILVAVAGPDGAGKTAFYHAHLEPAGLRFVDADVLARELGLSPCDAARVAAVLRRELVRQRESFVYETVFLDS